MPNKLTKAEAIQQMERERDEILKKFFGNKDDGQTEARIYQLDRCIEICQQLKDE